MAARALASALVALALVPRAHAGAVPVGGDTTCPTPAQVAAELERILPEDEANGAGGATRAHLALRGAVLWVELRDAGSGAPVAARGLAASRPCAALASVAAVVIAAWNVEFASRATAPPVFAARPPVVAVPISAVAPVSRSLELSAALLGSLAGGALAPGGLVELAVPHGPEGLAQRLTMTATSGRDLVLLPGAARWRRLAVGVGPRYRLPLGAASLDLHAEVLGAWLTVSGRSYDVNRGSSGLDVGLGAGLRAVLGRGRMAPWLGAAICGWPGLHQIEADGVSSTARVPPLELIAAAGLAFRAGR